MNRNHRRYNRNQPPHQANRTNLLPPTPSVNNSPQNENSERESDNIRNNHIIPSPNKNAWRYADTIAVFALIVGVVMAVVTYNLFSISQYQAQSVIDAGNAAKTSATIARNTLTETQRFNSLTLSNQQKSDRKSDTTESIKRKNDKATFELQQKVYTNSINDAKKRFYIDTQTLHLQIKGLKQTQDQFTKQYEPYLKLNVDSIIVRFNKLYIYYTMFNLTNTPVKVVSIESTAYIRGTESIIPVKMPSPASESMYIIKETPQIRFFSIPYATTDEIKYVVTGLWSVFWDVEFEYINQITDEKRRYIVSVKLNKTRGENPPYPTYKKNDNISN
ncbi:hypothetical protein [Mucilaginibacter sp. dw_454]|uniref:hypothetical protein n=1 Tax=Mucilaginibacter sp. dw_454 TaxID=2720079 RepID=UPI001BD2D738|nr:hypothetical protein [Mucilaginibacter sp. dw_454]